MDIANTIREIPQTVLNVISSSKESIMSIVLKLSKLRNDPDFFQKVFQVASAALDLHILKSPAAASLSELSFVLKTVNMHDYYEVLKLPRQLLFPRITPRTIDDNAVLISLIGVIQNHLRHKAIIIGESEIANIAKKCLKNEFKWMEKAPGGVTYTSKVEFRQVLQKWVRGSNVLLEDISLRRLDVPLLPVSNLSLFQDFAWFLVEIECVALYLKEWNFIDTAKYAERIGGWARTTSLSSGVYFLLSGGFALRFCEAVRKLQQDRLTSAERSRAKWDIVTSLFELALYGISYLDSVGYLTINQSSLLWLTLIAKSFGLLSVSIRPKHKFFEPRIGPAI